MKTTTIYTFDFEHNVNLVYYVNKNNVSLFI